MEHFTDMRSTFRPRYAIRRATPEGFYPIPTEGARTLTLPIEVFYAEHFRRHMAAITGHLTTLSPLDPTSRSPSSHGSVRGMMPVVRALGL